jgi:hypothetical protein
MNIKDGWIQIVQGQSLCRSIRDASFLAALLGRVRLINSQVLLVYSLAPRRQGCPQAGRRHSSQNFTDSISSNDEIRAGFISAYFKHGYTRPKTVDAYYNSRRFLFLLSLLFTIRNSESGWKKMLGICFIIQYIF